jgi:hypothetical protein
MSEQPISAGETPDGALVSSLSVVEAQPLDQRAEGYAGVYEELRRRLESDDIAE